MTVKGSTFKLRSLRSMFIVVSIISCPKKNKRSGHCPKVGFCSLSGADRVTVVISLTITHGAPQLRKVIRLAGHEEIVARRKKSAKRHLTDQFRIYAISAERKTRCSTIQRHRN